MLLFQPILKAKYSPSQVKFQINLLQFAKKCLKPLDFTFFVRNLLTLIFSFLSLVLLVETQD